MGHHFFLFSIFLSYPSSKEFRVAYISLPSSFNLDNNPSDLTWEIDLCGVPTAVMAAKTLQWQLDFHIADATMVFLPQFPNSCHHSPSPKLLGLFQFF